MGILIALGIFFPLVGVSLLVVFLFDWLVVQRIPAVKKVAGLNDQEQQQPVYMMQTGCCWLYGLSGGCNGRGLTLDKEILHDGEQISVYPIQCQSRGEIDSQNQNHKRHDDEKRMIDLRSAFRHH